MVRKQDGIPSYLIIVHLKFDTLRRFPVHFTPVDRFAMTTHTYRLALCILMGHPYLLYQDPRHRSISVGVNPGGSTLMDCSNGALQNNEIHSRGIETVRSEDHNVNEGWSHRKYGVQVEVLDKKSGDMLPKQR